MFAQLFKRIGKPQSKMIQTTSKASNIVKNQSQLSKQLQKEKHKQRRQLIINQFGKSVINFLQDHDIWTPLHIVDFLEVNLLSNDDLRETVIKGIQDSHQIHQENLREKLYQKSFNFQPSYLLMVVKDKKNNIVTSFKNRSDNLEQLLTILKPKEHRLLLVRYFIPLIPEDLYKYDDVLLPPKFQEAVEQILNYVDLNYSIDNVTANKWKSMIFKLHDLGVRLNLPQQTEEIALTELLSSDYSDVGYEQLRVTQIVKEKVERNPIAIPAFILLLALFCSDKTEQRVFTYHYLFSPTGSAKKRSMNRGDISFQKLFNQLLDESLLPEQFNKCLFIIYNQAFHFKQTEIDDLLLSFREYSHES